jgi:hypothetical protein
MTHENNVHMSIADVVVCALVYRDISNIHPP